MGTGIRMLLTIQPDTSLIYEGDRYMPNYRYDNPSAGEIIKKAAWIVCNIGKELDFEHTDHEKGKWFLCFSPNSPIIFWDLAS